MESNGIALTAFKCLCYIMCIQRPKVRMCSMLALGHRQNMPLD